jgi:hypothetical protein
MAGAALADEEGGFRETTPLSGTLSRGRVVPGDLHLTAELSTARRRMTSMARLTTLVLVAFLAIYLLAVMGSRLTVLLVGVMIGLMLVTWLVDRNESIESRRATDFTLVAWVVVTWLASVVQHFGYDGRVDMFTGALFPVFLMPLYAGVGRARFVPAILLMGLAQPVVALWSHVVGASVGSDRDVVFSAIGAGIVMALAWGGCLVMQSERHEGARDIGGYRLVRRIGSGGMGEVWEGRHRFLASSAAIKLFNPSPETFRPELIRRFEREAQATALLTSEHTVRLFDFGRAEDGRLYYVMELLEGLDLQRLIERRGPLSPDHVVSVMMQVCDSLGEAHQRGFVHRDVKPSNIFLARRGLRSDFVKMLDFGLVKVDDASGTLTRADASIFLGTATYASPEALRGERQGPPSDVYQMGCVMFFLLTGHLVFERASSIAVALAHSSEAPPALSEVAGQLIPSDLEQVIQRCLAKDPEQRPASAIELAEELLELESAGRWTLLQQRGYWRWGHGDEGGYFDQVAHVPSPSAESLPRQS